MRSFPRPFAALALAVVALVATPAGASAAFVVSIEPVTVSRGGTAYAQVTLTNDSGSEVRLSAFSLELLLGGTGVVFADVDTNTTPAYVFGSLQLPPFSFNTFPNSSFIASDIFLSPPGYATIGANETVGLARIQYAAGAGAVDGPRPVSFGALTQFFADDGSEISDVQLPDGTVTVSGGPLAPTPAPSGLVLLFSGAGFGFVARLWRQRK